MPIQYEGILAEHEWTRSHASIFDICHMGEFQLEGSKALQDLDRLVTCSLSSLEVGQCRYGYLLNEQGGVLDDLTVYRRSEDAYFVVVNAADVATKAAWFRDHCSDLTRFSDLSSELAKLDVQGPEARVVLESIGGSLPDLKFFRFDELDFLDADMMVSRTGYTGEFGYELYFPADLAGKIWERLLEHPSLKPGGLGARDTLRLEVGYPLYGHELTEDRTPVGVCRGRFIDRDKEFIGKDAVERDLDHGVDTYLTGLKLEGRRAAREGSAVLAGGYAVGSVTSGSFAPSIGSAVALAMVPDALTEAGTEVDVDIRGKAARAVVVTPPFYTEGTARRPAKG